jgi:aspartate aminotransferase
MMTNDKAFMAACTRLQGQQLTCATMVAQKAAEVALTSPQDTVEAMRCTFEERRNLICRLAAEIPGFKFREPKGAFYLFPDVTALGTGDEVAEMLLEKAHVATVSGSAFGYPSCIRLSYAISTEEIIEAMARIKKALTA